MEPHEVWVCLLQTHRAYFTTLIVEIRRRYSASIVELGIVKTLSINIMCCGVRWKFSCINRLRCRCLSLRSSGRTCWCFISIRLAWFSNCPSSMLDVGSAEFFSARTVYSLAPTTSPHIASSIFYDIAPAWVFDLISAGHRRMKAYWWNRNLLQKVCRAAVGQLTGSSNIQIPWAPVLLVFDG